eukprot:g5229.t1
MSLAEWKADFVKRGVLNLRLIGPGDRQVTRNWEISKDATCGELIRKIGETFDVAAGTIRVAKASRPDDTTIFTNFEALSVSASYPGPELCSDETLLLSPVRKGDDGAVTGRPIRSFADVSDSSMVDMQDYKKYLDSHTTIRGNARSHVMGVLFSTDSPFVWQDHTKRRMGYCYGSIDRNAASQSLGWVKIEAVYEPPQFGFKHRCLEFDDADRDLVDRVARNLGLELVGWIFSHPYRKRETAVSRRRKQGHRVSAMEHTPPLQSAELMRAAELQNTYGQHFVTLVITKDRKDDEEFFSAEAWQVSDQCVKLRAADQLRQVPNDPYVVRTTVKVRSKGDATASITVAGGASKRQQTLTNLVDADFLVSYCGIKRHVPRLKQLGGFPVLNRRRMNKTRDLVELTFDEVVQIFKQPNDRLLDVLADFNALLFVAKRHGHFMMTMGDVDSLCVAVREEDEDTVELFRPKIEGRLGLGFRCPVCAAHGILTGGYTVDGLLRHVRGAHRNDLSLVQCPIEVLREKGGVEGMKRLIKPPYKDHLKELVKREGSTIVVEADPALCREEWNNPSDRRNQNGGHRRESDDSDDGGVRDMSMSDDDDDDDRDGGHRVGRRPSRWQFEESRNDWRDCEPNDCAALDRALLQGRNKIMIRNGRGTYDVVITRPPSGGGMVTARQTNRATNNARRLRRLTSPPSFGTKHRGSDEEDDDESPKPLRDRVRRRLGLRDGDSGARFPTMTSPAKVEDEEDDDSDDEVSMVSGGIDTLVGMGYDRESSTLALDCAQNDVGRAVDVLTRAESVRAAMSNPALSLSTAIVCVSIAGRHASRDTIRRLLEGVQVLRGMGFQDDKRSAQALKNSNFDVNRAVGRLM